MKKHKLVLFFTLFFGILLIFFIYYDKINVDCEKLGERDCYSNNSCHASTGPSICNGTLCTKDIGFYSCLNK